VLKTVAHFSEAWFGNREHLALFFNGDRRVEWNQCQLPVHSLVIQDTFHFADLEQPGEEDENRTTDSWLIVVAAFQLFLGSCGFVQL